MCLGAGSYLTRDLSNCELEESSSVQPVRDIEFMCNNEKWRDTQQNCVLFIHTDDAT